MVGAPQIGGMPVHRGAPRVVKRLGQDHKSGLFGGDLKFDPMRGEVAHLYLGFRPVGGRQQRFRRQGQKNNFARIESRVEQAQQ